MNRTTDIEIARLINLDGLKATRDELRAIGPSLADPDLARLTHCETLIDKVEGGGSFEFTYDLTLTATVRVKASSQREALKLIRDAIDGSEANLGAWPNGDPIVSTIGIEGDADLYDIDGEFV